MKNNIHLLVIDPQVDFCTPVTPDYQTPLYVPGAEKDMTRLAAMVGRLKNKISAISVTLDSHHFIHIAHPAFWKDSQGNQPNPFTPISAKDIETGKWTPRVPSLYKEALEYAKELERKQRYSLFIWPPHCLIGHKGHNVVPELWEQLTEWEKKFAVVNYITKGSNVMTEHYSAFSAEVPRADDPGTQISDELIKTIEQYDTILLCGEALSHCLASTVRDLANNFTDPKYIQKLVLLRDATGSVGGFEKNGEDFIKELTAKGMQVTTTAEFLK